MAGRMTLSGRVVSSERGGRGIPSWWMLVGTNTGGNTGGEGCVCGGGGEKHSPFRNATTGEKVTLMFSCYIFVLHRRINTSE